MSASPLLHSRERLLFAAAVVIIGVHTVADSFLTLEPGVRTIDHLPRGLVTLGVLASAVALYARSRPGARAVVALVVGALALEGFALAIAGARSVGPSGDDWTGFGLAPAGLILVALGVAILWRSRKPHGRRYLRRLVVAGVAVLGIYWVVMPIGIAVLATHRPEEAVAHIDLGRQARAVTVRTADGLVLRGRYVASQNGAGIIVYPGSASRLPQARALVRRGYGVLMLDPRGYARSEGDPNTFGWSGTSDIDAGIAFLARRPEIHGARIGGLGFSVGGEVMLDAAARNPALRAVVADGAGERSVRESRLRGKAGWFSLPSYFVLTAAVTVLSSDWPPPSLVDVTPRIAPRSLLLIGAGRDNGGEDLQPLYFAAARAPKAFWKIPEAGHTGWLRSSSTRIRTETDAVLRRRAVVAEPRTE